MPKALFELGKLVATPGALRAFRGTGEHPFTYLQRHVTGDWGELDAEDKASNDESVHNRTRILSAYKLNNETKIWIITEADRSVTTILLPDEY